MSTIRRTDFLQQYANKSLDLNKLDEEAKSKLERAGSSAEEVSRSDLNGDGKIAGARELRSLFKHMDDFDRNGSARSFIATDRATGEATQAGKVYNTLSLLFERETGTVTSTTSSDVELGKKWAEAGAASIDSKMKGHLHSIEETGVGLYYGDHSSFNSMNRNEREAWIEGNLKPGATAPSPKRSSCIGWAMENLKEAYTKAGKAERWDEIQSIVYAKGTKGTDLAKELQKDGWQGIYWNPDAKHPDDGNNEHTYTARLAANGRPYYGIRVDDQVINYRPTPGKGTTHDLSGIEKLREVPFFFGVCKGGMHTFVGREGKVNEFHWAEMPDSERAIEETPLEDFMWNSGVIMVPPGTWPAS